MKFEDYLKANGKELNQSLNKEELWSKMEGRLPKMTKSIWSYNRFAVAASVIIIVGSFFYFSQKEDDQIMLLADQNNELKSQIIHLIKEEKTTSRIKAVSLSEDISDIDEEIIMTLVDRMRFDESPNVQLAAIRALESRMDSEIVRVAMIETLATVEDSYLQIKLIDMLSKEKEKRALPYLKSIISEQGKTSIVIDPAKDGIRLLEGI